MAYIYHNKEIDEYWAFTNLKTLSEQTAISHDTLSHWFSREKLERVDRDNWVIVKTKLVKRKGSKK